MGGYGSGMGSRTRQGCKNLVERVLQIKIKDLASIIPKRSAGDLLAIPTENPNMMITWMACRFGGTRAYFVCPGCLNICSIIYANGSNFECRKCNGLIYLSQRLKPIDRAIQQEKKIRRQLGRSIHAKGNPPRPKGMHKRTYKKNREKLWSYQIKQEELNLDFLENLLRQCRKEEALNQSSSER